jgi:hypothetical protein
MELDTVLSLAGNRVFIGMQYAVMLAFIILVALPVLSGFLTNLPRLFGKGR